ncbi:hypothetical protein BX616_009070 [Lobosporangium transversale]|uniref:RF-1 domain-domain-containing protein n=1 Tax=Lobosporangium transversale TaxID=64571 RepID=A0A1Y2GFX0_9FUNG|nr:RF-1 domain-domain-containing protein [Lobosporangium transversale]KAF9918388.1 hypothetical protein BX616_009070 [Lobosporangium transversale]ORZ07977.1 RF-1 domain-domain-containing protein [Lobosporangium transversale]|eukprot:XP_021878211.1 RF-1 domain-domain-containing protein [Lobosporangium transversale]
MATMLARSGHCYITLLHRAAVTAGQYWLGTYHFFRIQSPTLAAFSNLRCQQVPEAFLRAGPGRDHASIPVKDYKQANALTIGHTELESPDQSESFEENSATSTTINELASSFTSLSSKEPFQYKEITLLETDFRERFIKGGGNGGQKINKTNSNVELKHFETGIVVQCQATRSLPQNRKLARKILFERLDEYYNGDMSKRGQKAQKIRRKKLRMARKSAKKYHGRPDDEGNDGNDGDDNDDSNDDYYGNDIVKNNNDSVNDGNGQKRNELDKEFATSNVISAAKANPHGIPDSAIRLSILEEVLSSTNKRPSRRKSKRKD